jgi:membrane fusion protein, multidrug efflux system
MREEKENMTETPKSKEPFRSGTVAVQAEPEERTHDARKSRWWVWVLIVVLAIAGIIAYRQHQATSSARVKAAPPVFGVPVQVAKAMKGNIGEYVVALGTVTPVYTVTVTSRVLGEIINVYYKEGQMVRKGDPLLDIDPRPYQAAVTQAEGQLAHDQAVLSEAGIDYERYKAALARNAIAQQQVSDQEQVVHQDEGTVKTDQGNLDNAKVNLAYTHITSPIDGRVGLRLVDPGNIVQANSTTALVVITQLEPITVVFSVGEDYLGQIEPQISSGARMQVDALDRQQLTRIASGYLLTVDNEVDVTTGTVKLKAQFDNKDGALFPSEFVNARLLLKTLQDATLVPAQAVQQGSQGAFVFKISPDQTASMQPVKTITSDGNVTAVDGVDPGSTVAATGFDKLQDGSKVSVRNAPDQSGGGNAVPYAGPGLNQGQLSQPGKSRNAGQGSGGGQGRPAPGQGSGSNKP